MAEVIGDILPLRRWWCGRVGYPRGGARQLCRIILPVRRHLLILPLLLVCACSTNAPSLPAPTAPPETPAPPRPEATVPQEERVMGTVRVTASALNVRAEASADAEVVTQVKKGTALSVLQEGPSWVKVRLAGGEVGWVAARFVSSGTTTAAKRRTGGGKCPPDSDYAFLETPQLRGSDQSASGLVVVEANVNTRGIVTSTKVISNSTKDEALAFLAEKEIQSAKFSPPIRNCVPRAFIFTYRRTF
ncbi:MAG TPA: SH3 domain-containing protein [Thermoanaerobaculia bacterium]|nr:SH3 domain-containing protein [Thermoanaerobaculia bacterium]